MEDKNNNSEPSRAIRFVLFGLVAIGVIATSIAFAILHTDDFDTRIRFALSDHNGNAVTESTYRGQHLLVFFGFTNCPQICPTQMTKLTRVVDRLEATLGSESLVPLFVSIDAERDSVQKVQTYVSHFHPRFVGLTGTAEALARARRSFNVLATASSDDSAVRHSSVAYLVDADGYLVTHIAPDATVEESVNKIQEAML